MGTVFLATLGQCPEAITLALDRLHERYQYADVILLHTDPQASGMRLLIKSWSKSFTRIILI